MTGFPENTKTVDVIAIGRERLIAPSKDSWDHWFGQLEVIPDFMADREQPAEQEQSVILPQFPDKGDIE